MADDDWTMGELAAQDAYEPSGFDTMQMAQPGGFAKFVPSTNVEDRRPTSLHEFTAREPVLVPGFTDKAHGWGDMIEKAMLHGDPGPDRTFGHDPHGFKAAIDAPPPRAFPHPTQGNPADIFEGRLGRQEFMDQMDRSMDKAMRENPGWADRRMSKDLRNTPVTQLSDDELAMLEEMLRQPPIDPNAGPPTGDETNVMARPSPYPPPGQPWPAPKPGQGPILPPPPWLPPDWRARR
jgi:hypothetical protein